MEPRHDVAFELGLQQPLGRDVQKLELAAVERASRRDTLGAFQRRVDEGRFDAVVLQQANLVLHQRDERRNHDADAAAEQRR
jgi:hypothetical protein